MMFWGWNAGVGWIGAIIGMLVWLAIVGLFVWIVVRLVSGPRSPDRYWAPGPQAEDPEQILRARFARGEIGPDEFEQRLEVLRRTRSQGPPPR